MIVRNKIFLPLSLKLFAIFMLVVLVPLTLALGVSWGNFNSRLFEVAAEHLKRSADEAEQILQSDVISRAWNIASSEVGSRVWIDRERPQLERLIRQEMQVAGLTFLVVADRRGRPFLERGSSSPEAVQLSKIYRLSLRGHPQRAITISSRGEMTLHGVVPLRGRGQVLGLVDTGIRLDSSFATRLSQAVGQEISFLDQQGRRRGASLSVALDRPLPAEITGLLQRGLSVSGRIVRIGGQDYLSAYHPLRLNNGEVAGAWGVEQPLAPVYAAQRERGLQLLQIVGFAIPIVIILVYFFARLFTDALNRLAQASRSIASGDYTQPVALTSLDKWTFDEVGELSRNFEEMRQSLLKKQSAIEEHIRELSRLNEQVRLEKTTMEAVLNSLTDGLVVVDAQGKLVLFNPAAARLLHLQPTSRGQVLLELLRSRPFNFRLGGEALEHHCHRVLAAGEAWDDEVTIPGAITYQFKFVPIAGADGAIRGGVATFHDITEIRRIDQLKSDFISVVSHELRTPLTSIHGYLTLVQAGRVTDLQQIQQILSIVLNQTEHLSSLVSNLLDLARIEAGRIVMKREALALGNLVDQVVLNLRHLANEKQIALQTDIPPDLPAVLADPERISQVLTNLVGNALKFTPAGLDQHVLVRARSEGGMVRVEVSDDGCGIPEEALPRLFTRFYQVDSSDTRSVGGSGLGLAIVKRIIEEHGGTVSVSSRLNEGSTFTFTLPTSPPERTVPVESILSPESVG